MEKITPQPAAHGALYSLEAMAASSTLSLDERGLTDIVRLLISKVNQLSGEVDYLRNRVNQQDSFT